METPGKPCSAHPIRICAVRAIPARFACCVLAPTPVRATAWEVRDVVGHLILGAELYFGVVSRGLHGDTSPRKVFRRQGASMRRPWRFQSTR